MIDQSYAQNPTLRRDIIQPYIDAHPSSLLFVTVSGAHLYGFASPDSDYDLRGCHVESAARVLSLSPPRETHEVMDKDSEVEMDLVTHDAIKFFKMLVNKNGYVLEQIFSPIVLQAASEFEELREIAARCVTKHHRHHFRSFAQNQWDRVAGPASGTVKGLLYTYRPLLAGIHLMTEKQVESNLVTLNERFRLSYIDELIERKRTGAEKQSADGIDFDFHRDEFERLKCVLDEESQRSDLPDLPAARDELDALLVKLRLQTLDR